MSVSSIVKSASSFNASDSLGKSSIPSLKDKVGDVMSSLTSMQDELAKASDLAKQSVLDKLEGLGLPDSVMALLKPAIESKFASVPSILSMPSFSSLSEVSVEQSMAEAMSKLEDAQLQKAMEKEKDLIKAHDPQIAKQAVSMSDHPVTTSYVTKPVEVIASNNSLDVDYPHTYGFTDKSNNYYKINQKSGTAEFVHHSGTRIQIDNDGNVAIVTQKSIKHDVQGDYTLQVKGNIDIVCRNNINIQAQSGECSVSSKGLMSFKTSDSIKSTAVKDIIDTASGDLYETASTINMNC